MTGSFIKPKRRCYTALAPFPRLAAVAEAGWCVVAINWLFQGMRGMQRKELSFRLATEAAVATMFGGALAACGIPWVLAGSAALLGAHTLAFTLNGQAWVAARYLSRFQGDVERVGRFLDETVGRLRDRSWLNEAVIIGSVGRGGLSPRSDIDLRLVFPPGRLNWTRTNLLLLDLRTRAFLRRVPLDLYAYDAIDTLARFDQAEPLAVVLDRHARIAHRFPARTQVHYS